MVKYWTFRDQERLDFLLPHLPTFEKRTRSIKANLTGGADMRMKLRTAVVESGPNRGQGDPAGVGRRVP